MMDNENIYSQFKYDYDEILLLREKLLQNKREYIKR
jgi:hypothetical protein